MREIIWSAGPSRHDYVRYDSENHLFPGKKFSDYGKIYCDVSYLFENKQRSMVINGYPVKNWIELSQDKHYQQIHEIVYLSDNTWKKNNPKACIHRIMGIRNET